MSNHFYRIIVILSISVSLTACSSSISSLANKYFKKSVDSAVGELNVDGLSDTVIIRRDEFGAPAIEAQSEPDMFFASGWVAASDRLGQMYQLRNVANGRISESAGEKALDIDRYMRALSFKQTAISNYKGMSEEGRKLLEKYSDGVNAYVKAHEGKLDFSLAFNDGLDPWTPEDSISVFLMFSLGVGVNFVQEMMLLSSSQLLPVESLPWLAPVYYDDELRHEEAKKLQNIDLGDLLDVKKISKLNEDLLSHGVIQGVAASNNWVVAPKKTKNGASLLESDPHLAFTHPGIWSLLSLKSPNYHAAGVTIPGIPMISIGYNGKIAWGITMVMADGQDSFIEKLKTESGKSFYLRQEDGKDVWHPVKTRTERIYYGKDQYVDEVIRETDHGPIVSDFMKKDLALPLGPMRTAKLKEGYGISLSWTINDHPDPGTIDAFYNLGKAQDTIQARAAVKDIRAIPLNIVFADKDNIGWQVSGRYPKRKKGTGLFPSPAWTGEYGWNGYESVDLNPSLQNPEQGYIATANQRTVVKDYPLNLTESWFSPSRFDRIDSVLAASDQHDIKTVLDLQVDSYSTFHELIKKRWTEHKTDLVAAIELLPAGKKEQAQKALDKILSFDGYMKQDSSSAALWGVFQHAITRAIFLDELGPEDSQSWDIFMQGSFATYNAMQDHLRGRAGSPFWDNTTTEKTENEWDTVAVGLVESWSKTEELLGKDANKWAWGSLLKYEWRTGSTDLKPLLPKLKGTLIGLLKPYLDRGPYPAQGDMDTVNVAGVALGNYDFKIHFLPSMRMAVDFSMDEPLHLILAGAQSGNPSSPHYSDGHEMYLKRQNRQLPFNDEEKVKQHYKDVFTLNAKK